MANIPGQLMYVFFQFSFFEIVGAANREVRSIIRKIRPSVFIVIFISNPPFKTVGAAFASLVFFAECFFLVSRRTAALRLGRCRDRTLG